MQGWVAKNSLDELVCCWVFLLPSSLMIDIGPVYCLISLPRLWRSLILGSDQTFVILVLFMEMLLLTSLVLNAHLVISTISSWKKFCLFFHHPQWDVNMNKDQLSSRRSRVNVRLLAVWKPWDWLTDLFWAFCWFGKEWIQYTFTMFKGFGMIK